MKRIFIFLALIFFIAPLNRQPSAVFAEQPKYILFDNLENKNFVDSAYWNYLIDPQYMPEIAPYVIRKPFNDVTLQQYKLTDFDVAIFLLGDNRLNTRVGNASVLNAIRQMIAAGKNCLIIGRNVLYYAFNPAGGDLNPEVQKFLSDTLGIEYLTRMKVSRQTGNQIEYWSFNIRGAYGDPVGQSIIKWCNIGYTPQPGVTWWPLAIYLDFDVFKSKDPVKYPPVDHFIRTNNDYPDDTIVGIRTEIGTARLCFWSIGFEAFAGDIPRAYQLLRAINWLKGNIAPDGATYDVDPIIVDFGEVEPGKSDTIEMKIISTGKLDLVLEEIDFWENPDDVFEIISGKITKPITLKRGQSHSVKIKFTPKEKIGYKGSLSIKSNALYQEYRYIEVWGYGGGIQAKGPILTTNFPENLIDFGKVKKPTSKIIELVLKNIGDQTLEISEFKIDTTYKDYKRFDFAQVLQTPIYIEPGDSVKVKVRFSAATDEERVYNARIRVVTNAKENKEFYIELRGEVEGLIFVDGENNLSSPVKIISNPLSQTIEVQFNNLTLNKPVSISVFNNLSQNIETLNFQTEEIVSNHINLDLNNLPSGAYYIIVRTNGEQFVFPFVLVR
jgi:hypothetical protein